METNYRKTGILHLKSSMISWSELDSNGILSYHNIGIDTDANANIKGMVNKDKVIFSLNNAGTKAIFIELVFENEKRSLKYKLKNYYLEQCL